MAAIENLEIVVNVDIAEALADLRKLQDELENVADEISSLRREGRRGVDVSTHVDAITDDLARMRTEIEAFERATSIDIDTDIDDVEGLAAAAAASSAGGGGGYGGVSFNRPFLAQGSRAAASMDDISGGMGMIFGDQRRDDPSGLQKVVKKLGDTFDDAMESLSEFDIRMSDLHNALARLVPLIFVFIGAIPAVMTAMAGLAAAAVAASASLLALAGFGALGFGMAGGEFDAQRLSDAFSDVREDFLDAFAPMANELQPLFEDMLDGLESFFRAVADQGDALLALEGEARSFGDFIMSFVPDMLRTLAAMVEGLSYLFGDLGRFLNRNFTDIMRTLTELTAEITPVMAALGQALGGLLVGLARVSTGFLQVVNVITSLIGGLAWLINLFGVSARGFGIVVSGALAAASAILLARTALVQLIWQGFISLAGTIYSYFVPAVATIVSGFTSSAAATYLATAALASFLTLATLGAATALIGMATSAAAEFTNLAGSIGDASSALKDFRSVQSGMNGAGFGGSGSDNPYGFSPDNPKGSGGGNGSVTVFNVESSGDPDEDRSNLEHADWLSGRTTK